MFKNLANNFVKYLVRKNLINLPQVQMTPQDWVRENRCPMAIRAKTGPARSAKRKDGGAGFDGG